MTPKIANYEIVFQEFPDEVILALNFSGCPNRCPGCHSVYLQSDHGVIATDTYIHAMIDSRRDEITCVGLMGGDAYPDEICRIASYIHSKWPHLKVGWYSGTDRKIEDIISQFDVTYLDYIKIGSYKQECGPLDNPNTNQHLYMKVGEDWEDITYKFWKNT